MLSDRSPYEVMLGDVECVSRDPRHQRLPGTGVDDAVEAKDVEDAMVLLLERDPNTDVLCAPSVTLLRRCGDNSQAGSVGDRLGVPCLEDVCTTCTESLEFLRDCCDEETLRLNRNIAGLVALCTTTA